MTRVDVSVVISCHNDRECLARCLAALQLGRNEVIVVDNASCDGSADLVLERFAEVRLVQLVKNSGFGAAMNAGIRLASGRYVLLLNADAWPCGDAVAELVAFADARPAVGLVGPRLLNLDGSLQRSVRGFPTLWRLATEFFFLRKLGPGTRLLNGFYAANFDHATTREVEFLKGAALLVRRTAIEDVGGFDETFFVFSEDADLCYRMRKADWGVMFYPGARFVHVGGTSTHPQWDRMFREQLRGQLLFFAKHTDRLRAERARTIMLLGLRLRGLLFRGRRRHTYRRAAGWLASTELEALVEGQGR